MKIIQRLGFIDGIKPAYNPVAIPKTAVWEGRNIDVDDIGILRIRPGSKALTTSLGLGGVKGAVSAFNTLLIVWNKSLYKLVGSTWTAIKENFLADTDVTMEVWSEGGSEVVYLHDGNGIWKTDGSTCDRITPYTPQTGEPVNLLRATNGTQDLNSVPAKGKIVVFKHDLASRMAVAYGNDICLSYPGDPSYFPDDQVIHLPDDGGYITALSVLYGVLIIYRNKDVWAFLGKDVTDVNASLVIQDSSIGCAASKSVAYIPGLGEIFLGPDNVYALQGFSAIPNQYKAVPIGDDIVPYLRRVMASDGAAVYYNREYRLCFPNAVEPERVFRLKTSKKEKPWYIDTGPRASLYVKHNDKLYAASPTEGVLKEISGDYRTDDGAAIPFFATFSHENLGSVSYVKRLYVYINSRDTLQHLNAAVIADGRQVQTVELSITAASGADFIIGRSGIGVSRIGRMSEVKVYEGRVYLKGSFAQVRVMGTAPDEDIGVIGYALEFDPIGKLKGVREGVNYYGN